MASSNELSQGAAMDGASVQPSRSANESAVRPIVYKEAFLRGQPRETLQVIQQRIRAARQLNDELADYFRERAIVEDTYAKSLQKLMSKRGAGFLSDAEHLGTFRPVWNSVFHELSSLSDVHYTLSRRITDEVEDPIRTKALGDSTWSSLKDLETSLTNIARVHDEAKKNVIKNQKKMDGAKNRDLSSARLQESNQQVDMAMRTWHSEADMALEKYQKADEARWESLKEAFARFETASSDAANRRAEITERSMQAVITFDVQAEINEFTLKNSTSSSMRSITSVNAPVTPAREGSMLSRSDSVASSRTGTGTGSGPGTAAASAGSRNATGRLSTYSNDIDADFQPRSAKRSSTLRLPFGKLNLGRFASGLGTGNSSPGSDRTEERIGGMRAQDRSVTSTSTIPEDVSDTDAARASEYNDRQAAMATDGRPTPAARRTLDAEPSSLSPAQRSSRVDEIMRPTAAAPPVISPTRTMSPDPFPAGEARKEPIQSAAAPVLPPVNLDDQVAFPSSGKNPFSSTESSAIESSDAAAFMQMKSALQSQSSGRGSSRRTKRGVSDGPTASDDPQGQIGLVSEPGLSAAAPPSRMEPAVSPVVPLGSTNGSTHSGSLPLGSVGGAARQASTMPLSAEPQSILSPLSADENPFADSQSSGLMASVTETISVTIEGGRVTKLQIVGEVGLMVKESTKKMIPIVLTGTQGLAQLLPNSKIVKSAGSSNGPSSISDRFVVNASSLSTSVPVPAYRYSMDVAANDFDAVAKTALPLDMTAAWRINPQTTDILVEYGPNKAFKGSGQGLSLQGLTVAILIGGSGTVTNFMSKPVGEWNKEEKSIKVRMPNAIALGTASNERILARAGVQGESREEPIQVKWRCPGTTISHLSIQLEAPDSATEELEIARTLQSGVIRISSR